jgi:hypothetical protein
VLTVMRRRSAQFSTASAGPHPPSDLPTPVHPVLSIPDNRSIRIRIACANQFRKGAECLKAMSNSSNTPGASFALVRKALG